MARPSIIPVRTVHPVKNTLNGAGACRVRSAHHRSVRKTHPTENSPGSVNVRRVRCAHRDRCIKRTLRPVCRAKHKLHLQAGLTYVEILIATLLIVVTLVPAMEALYPGVAGTEIHESGVEDHYRLVGRLEELLAEPFTDLDDAATAAGNETTPTTYSDTVTYGDGRQITRNVFLSRYDGDNADTDNNPFTGTEDDLLWMRVEITGTADGLESLISVYD